MTPDDVYRDYLAAVRAGDRRRAIAIVDRASEAGLDLPTLYFEVFQPTLREIGRLWQENEITVAEEHLATAITRSAMLRVYDRLELAEAGPPLLLAASIEAEQHEVGLRMLCDLMDLEGWDTIFLGSTVPTDSLVRMVQDRSPDVVALSVTLPPHVPAVRAAIAAIREAAGEPPPLIIAGGRPFLEDPALAERLGADLGATDAREAARLLRGRFPRGRAQ